MDNQFSKRPPPEAMNAWAHLIKERHMISKNREAFQNGLTGIKNDFWSVNFQLHLNALEF